MEFVDRQARFPNRVLISPESGTAFYATLRRADDPLVPGTPLNAESLNQLINRHGDTMYGALEFENPDAYPGIAPFGVSMGCGVLGGKGIAAFEVREGGKTTSPRLGRLEIGELGVSYVDPDGMRHYLSDTAVVDATVE